MSKGALRLSAEIVGRGLAEALEATHTELMSAREADRQALLLGRAALLEKWLLSVCQSWPGAQLDRPQAH